jgi:hypothetical protein
MNPQLKRVLFFGLSRAERRHRLQICLVVLLAVAAVSVIVVVGLHHVHRVPYRPSTLFNS